MSTPSVEERIWASKRLGEGLWHLKHAMIEIDQARQRFPELDKFYSDLKFALHEASKKSMVKAEL